VAVAVVEGQMAQVELHKQNPIMVEVGAVALYMLDQ
jgi:hypothetical protein